MAAVFVYASRGWEKRLPIYLFLKRRSAGQPRVNNLMSLLLEQISGESWDCKDLL